MGCIKIPCSHTFVNRFPHRLYIIINELKRDGELNLLTAIAIYHQLVVLPGLSIGRARISSLDPSRLVYSARLRPNKQ